MSYKAVVSSFILSFVLAVSISASDSLRTVAEMATHVYQNLNFADTSNGSAILDSHNVRRDVRDAIVEVGSNIGVEKAKTFVTANGTFGYLIDKHLDTLRAATLKRGRYLVPIDYVAFEKFSESFNQSGTVYDTSNYSFCATHGDSIYLYPPPARTDTIYIFYWARGKTPSAPTDTVDLPHELYTAVEYLATAKAAMRIKDYPSAQLFMQLYKNEESYFVGGKTPQ